ncbi:hypothetical protein SPRG_02292 [Saprolegnia parasitica CBS 223.65]|uniref:peptidylprolyl isomerase n=1 Tax=Saprolegnia parasitica (strain CBS 223.65) TaxID=695850 RepID=A0A067CRZ3_SAPPC|nr:hypothetical protein SPRG_02292 [Saprolegnia parasitica CBS 223.65]KDO33484.1 hypothetical protein SPRG_02292 [Saprolegnia parasitica CBS 223.65]|eukprot:XP_012196228.1 hypothetical protein SPRG_02292 [Saprolegnia parasitica CBS 223.65]
MDASLVTALRGLDKPTQKLLRNVVHLQPVQELLLTFLRDTSRSFEDWIWDPKTREVLGRVEASAEPPAAAPTAAHSKFNQFFADALLEQRESIDMNELLEAAEAEKTLAKERFARKEFANAMSKYKTIADKVKPHIAMSDGLCDLYVACCANVAVCAVKVQHWHLVRDYAHAALAVTKDHAKAWYCLAKFHVHEKCFNDALDALQHAITLNPNDRALLQLQAEIPAIEAKVRSQLEADQALLRKRAEADLLAKEEAAKRDAERVASVTRFVALPQPHATLGAISRLNEFVQRSRVTLGIESIKITEGPPQRFQCTMKNLTQNEDVLGVGEGLSKQEAKENAAKAAVLQMWQHRASTGTLHDDDKAFLATHPHILHTWSLDPPLDGGATPVVEKTYTCAIYPTPNDAMQAPNMLLNQYTAQGKMHFEYTVEDLSKRDASDFVVSGVLNGRCVATARGPSKKRAKLEVAEQALAIAYRESREAFPDQEDPYVGYR